MGDSQHQFAFLSWRLKKLQASPLSWYYEEGVELGGDTDLTNAFMRHFCTTASSSGVHTSNRILKNQKSSETRSIGMIGDLTDKAGFPY